MRNGRLRWHHEDRLWTFRFRVGARNWSSAVRRCQRRGIPVSIVLSILVKRLGIHVLEEG